MAGATFKPRDYIAIAEQYGRDVVNGEIPACEYVRLACQRQIDDLAAAEAGDFAYRFNPELVDPEGITYRPAERICRFIELLPHVKGPKARSGELIVLEPNQVWRLTTEFGWVDNQGLRRYRSAYTEIPRKNAKSTEAAGVALHGLACDGEMGAEVYSAAVDRGQARAVWDVAKMMVDRTPGLRRRFGVQTLTNSVFQSGTNSKFVPLSRETKGNQDGLNISRAVVDELHAHRTREMYDVLDSGTGSRDQPLLHMITTAGFDRTGICYELRSYLIKVLTGVIDDPTFFGIIYTIDEGDDWTDPAVWQKANPNWGVSVDPKDVEAQARKAMQTPAAQANFLTKRLNVWVNAHTTWLNALDWERCGNPELSIEQFTGEPCWVAVDLASKVDVASVAYVFKRANKLTAFVRNYLPEAAIERSGNSQYQGWALSGELIITPGDVIDFEHIEQQIEQDAKDYGIQIMGYDPWQATYLATRLQSAGLPVVEYRQTVQNMSEPMKELEAQIISGNFEHAACPVLGWMASNVVAHLDAKENIYPRKEIPENKIDGMVALIMAVGLAMSGQGIEAMPDDYQLMVV